MLQPCQGPPPLQCTATDVLHACMAHGPWMQAVDEDMLAALAAQGVPPLQMIKLRRLIATQRGNGGGGESTLPRPTPPMSPRMRARTRE